ncbi:MAG TPA: MFS transporter, partial [Acidimicrobiia bacterium]
MDAQRFRFGRLWASAVVSNLGDGLLLAALPLLGATVTDDPMAISLIALSAGLPWLLLGPFSGAVVDRVDRRVLMVSTDLVRASTLVLLGIVVSTGLSSIWPIYVVVFLVAGGETFVDTSAQAMLPTLVAKDRLDTANGRLFSTMTMANQFVGPPLGGLLFGIAAVLPVAADAASFAAAALLIFTLRGRFRPITDDAPTVEGILTSVGNGIRWLWHNKPIRAFAVGAALLNIGIVAGESILVLFATDQLGLTDAGFGALFAALAAGYMVGSSSAAFLTRRIGRLTIVISSVTAVAAALMLMGLAVHWSIAAAGLLIIGLASGLWDVIAVSFRQAAVPDRLLGRAMAAYRVVAHGALPVGALLGGFTARIGGNRVPFIVGAVVVT